MASPRVAVIVPVYNNGGTIAETLASLLAQTLFAECEVIIRDDASTDETVAIVRRIIARHPNMRLVAGEANLGVMGNYRALLAEVTAALVAPLEGDDLWHDERRLAVLAGFLEADPARVGCFSAFHIRDEASGRTYLHPGANVRRFHRVDAERLIEENIPASFSNCVYRTVCLREVFGRVEGHAGYDWLVNVLVAHAGSFWFVPEFLSTQRLRTTGAWSSLDAPAKKRLMRETLASMRALLPHRFGEIVSEMETRVGGAGA